MKIELEFTDAQWALLVDNYPKYPDTEGNIPEILTPELLSNFLMLDIKTRTTGAIQNKAAQAQKNAFDV